MLDDLSELEAAVLERIAKKYPVLQSHLQCLKVSNRRFTGVGLFTTLAYVCPDTSDLELYTPLNAHLSTSEIINVPGLKLHVDYEVAVTDGRVDFIEFVTPGVEWDGLAPQFSFTSYTGPMFGW